MAMHGTKGDENDKTNIFFYLFFPLLPRFPYKFSLLSFVIFSQNNLSFSISNEGFSHILYISTC